MPMWDKKKQSVNQKLAFISKETSLSIFNLEWPAQEIMFS